MSDRARHLQNSPWQGVLYITGGGAGFLAEILGTAGASRTVLEARVPYAATSLAELLGGAPDQACSAATARAMAMAALQRAMQLGATRPFGFACTASLATDRPKRGRCRAHIAVQTVSHSFHAEHGAFSIDDERAGQERELIEILWNVLLTALGLTTGDSSTIPSFQSAPESRPPIKGRLRNIGVGKLPTAPAWRRPNEVESRNIVVFAAPTIPEWRRSSEGESRNIVVFAAPAAPDWQALVEGKTDSTSTSPHDGALLLPGSFNPAHDAHRQMMRFAESKLGLTGAFELSIENVEKPLLDYFAIHARLEQLRNPVWLTRLPRFIDKARRFPGAVFALGIDTLIRIADSRYYRNQRERDRAIAEMLGLDVRFLVFGRSINGQFQGLGDASLPQALIDASTAVDEADFRLDMSSSGIRRN